MKKENTLKNWIDAGYTLFAEEGLEGMQVERLARMLQLNKSGFYHYFGDRDTFLDDLLKHHEETCRIVAGEFRTIQTFDPDFFKILGKHSLSILFNLQLVRHRHHSKLETSFERANHMLDTALLPYWSAFIQLPENPKLAHKYFEQGRDMFYSRVTPKNLSEEFLRRIVYDVRNIALELSGKNQTLRTTV